MVSEKHLKFRTLYTKDYQQIREVLVDVSSYVCVL